MGDNFGGEIEDKGVIGKNISEVVLGCGMGGTS